MKHWGQNYNPNQMLNFTRIDPFERPERLENLVTAILALIVTEKNPEKLVEALKITIRDYAFVSLGQGLRRLHSIATTGPELDFERDGLDALCYHLNGDCCEKGIAALQAVLKRFKELE